jgi:hypothetical protein
VSPDISQTIAPKRPLLLSHAVFCPIDQVSSNVHQCPPLPVKQYVETDWVSWKTVQLGTIAIRFA